MEFVCLPEIFRPSRAAIKAFEVSEGSIFTVPSSDDVDRALNFVAASVVSRIPESLRMSRAANSSADLLEKLVREIGKLSTKEILSTHCLIIGTARARFRKSSVVVGMAINQPMSFMAAEYDVKPDIEWLMHACDSMENDFSMFAFFLFFFLHVHPFCDGNGRMSRVSLLSLSRRRGMETEKRAVLVLAYIERYKVEFIKAMYMARINSPGHLISFIEQALIIGFDGGAASALAPHDQGD
ncbi:MULTISPECIES: Fic family protein [Xanthomonas]|uniref:Fic family protein n=1 Tax=Xanthomonas TaxID=338 RepID=UPI000E1EAB48|nr:MULTISPECIES: Fic family protein [Xanthomonas]